MTAVMYNTVVIRVQALQELKSDPPEIPVVIGENEIQSSPKKMGNPGCTWHHVGMANSFGEHTHILITQTHTLAPQTPSHTVHSLGLQCTRYLVALCRGVGISEDGVPCVCNLQRKDSARPN